jgi:transposase-like protein
MTRRQITAEFKAKIVLELLRKEQNLNEIATKNDISPNQLRNWKIEFLENVAKAFAVSNQEKNAKKAERLFQEEMKELMAKVGQLTIENDWLKKIRSSV